MFFVIIVRRIATASVGPWIHPGSVGQAPRQDKAPVHPFRGIDVLVVSHPRGHARCESDGVAAMCESACVAVR